jgi:prepilin-type N-terminal cleavage/methylation domain-containing protein
MTERESNPRIKRMRTKRHLRHVKERRSAAGECRARRCRSAAVEIAHGRRAFTLLELLVAIAILSLLVAAIVPAMSDDSDVRLRSTAAVVISDIEYAQVMTISDPREPVMVVFDPRDATYWLAFESDPAQPIARPGSGEPYEVTFGHGRAWAAEGVILSVANMPGNTLRFNAQAGLKDFTSAPAIRLEIAGGRSNSRIDINIAPITGRITEQFDR